LKTKINLTKNQEEIKRMRIKIDIKIKNKFWLNSEIENKLNFYKRANKKNKNQNNEDQIEKIILKFWIEGYYWKPIKRFKRINKKINRNKKNKNWILNTKNKEGQLVIFKEER